MRFVLPKDGAETREIILKYGLPKQEASYFTVDLSNAGKGREEYRKKIDKKLFGQMYYSDLTFKP